MRSSTLKCLLVLYLVFSARCFDNSNKLTFLGEDSTPVSTQIADGGRIAAACMKALMKNIPPSFCWKHFDFGTIPTLCPPGMFRSLALCYDYCAEGYTHVLGVCWKGIKSYIPHSVTNFSAVCEEGKYLMGALCYRDCKKHNMVNCGIGACAATSEGCASSIINMVAKVIEGVATAIVFVVSFGSSASAIGVKPAIEKAIIDAGKGAMKVAFNSMRRALLGPFKNSILQAALDLVSQNTHAFIMDVSTLFVSQFCSKIYEKIADEKIHEEPIDNTQRLINALDVFNIQGTVKDCKSGQTPAACAEDIVSTLSSFDPTGLLTIASAFIKPKCEGE